MNKLNPLVSIIVPIYNTASFLPKCIESIQSQSFDNIEIILVNDGSVDCSDEICKKFSDLDSRIKYIFKKNGGLSSARNAGLEIVTGAYISFIDSDDYIDPDFIKILLNSCIENQVRVSMCGRTRVIKKTMLPMFTLSSPQKWTSKEAIEKLLTSENIDGSACDKLFHKSLFQKRQFTIDRQSEDIPIVADILIEVDSIIHVGYAMYFYRQQENSITQEGFSIKKMGVLTSAEEVRQNVLKKFPDLKNKADYYYYSHLLYLLLLINVESNKIFIDERNFLKSILRKNIFDLLFNRYFSLKQKLKILLIYLNLFNKLMILKNKF